MGHYTLPDNLKNYRIHMIGIKGTGMAALTELLVSRGALVTGSDVPEEFYTDTILDAIGIRPMTPFSRDNLPRHPTGHPFLGLFTKKQSGTHCSG